jgi:hypothetical protein
MSWADHVTSWVADAPVAAWFAQRQELDAAAYASAWLTDIGLDPRSHAGDHRRWLDALAAADAVGVGMGWVAIRPSAATLVGAEDVSTAPRLPQGDEVVDALELLNRDALDAFALLASRPIPATGTRLFRAQALGGASGATPPIVGVAEGWRGDVVVDDLVATIVAAADGRRTLDELIEAAAGEFDLDPMDVLGGVLASIRGLVRTGVLRLESSDSVE